MFLNAQTKNRERSGAAAPLAVIEAKDLTKVYGRGAYRPPLVSTALRALSARSG